MMRRRSSPSSKETNQKKTKEPAPLKFSLSGDDTRGSGIDYNILNKEDWQTLEHYCKEWGIKQAHLESIYSRFERTIGRAEHGDFTSKPQSHASLDFLADEFMGTAGEFVAQIFIQTWFLRLERGLRSPEDRRSVNFARLVIMCCDLARLGDFELLSNLFGCLLPSKTLDLDTRLNSELIREVVTIMHTNPSKELDSLVNMLLAQAETDRDRRETKREARENGERGIDMERGPRPERQYLSLRRILRFSFQHPPLLFPAVQFQRVLRRKIIGSRFWLRRRKPASDRGVNLRSCLGLPDAYNDLFDRVETRRDAWVVASGHILLHALEGSGTNASNGGSGEWNDGMNERYELLLKNCLRPVWYIHEDTTKNLVCKVMPPSKNSPSAAGATTALTSTSDGSRARSAQRAESPAGGNSRKSGLTGGNAATNGVTKPCAVCLKRSSRFAMCGVCGSRAARSLKDAQGWRQARVLLERYGEPFGLDLPDALGLEGNAARRWVRFYDDEAGSDFYYNVHYDRSVWKGAIGLQNTGSALECRRHREKGAGMLRVASNTEREMITPPLISATSTPPKGTDGIATPLKTTRGKPPALSRPISRQPSERLAVLPGIVMQAQVEDCPIPDVVYDAHKRIYPPFRLVSREESAVAKNIDALHS